MLDYAPVCCCILAPGCHSMWLVIGNWRNTFLAPAFALRRGKWVDWCVFCFLLWHAAHNTCTTPSCKCKYSIYNHNWSRTKHIDKILEHATCEFLLVGVKSSFDNKKAKFIQFAAFKSKELRNLWLCSEISGYLSLSFCTTRNVQQRNVCWRASKAVATTKRQNSYNLPLSNPRNCETCGCAARSVFAAAVSTARDYKCAGKCWCVNMLAI